MADRCIVCGGDAEYGHSFGEGSLRAWLCLKDSKAYSGSPEAAREASVWGAKPIDTARRAVAFMDWLDRVLAERRNHGNEVKP